MVGSRTDHFELPDEGEALGLTTYDVPVRLSAGELMANLPKAMLGLSKTAVDGSTEEVISAPPNTGLAL